MAQGGSGRRIKHSVARAFELPRDIMLDLPRLTIIGALQLCIENHRGIIEYTGETIRVNLSGQELSISGANLAIGSITEDEIIIEGSIESLRFV
ncbi:MAG: YabP family protein [Planctomycetes bacterium ADurb.Bin412]|jgi:sporulation protein YqfC|nr:MAG: YabP family protein [Planctomycetes bacterium ADurb.Bin412]